MTIRVLWLDDEIDSVALTGTVNLAKKRFDIIKCKDVNVFFEKIKKEEWDAIILDVLDKGFDNTDFIRVLGQIIDEYKNKPWFVFSGQDEVISKESKVKKILDTNSYIREYASKDIYIKSSDEERLFDDIENAVKQKSVWQVKKKYRNVLSLFSDEYIGDTGKTELFDILLSMEGLKDISHSLYYTKLRIILESIFRSANKIGLLHDKCILERGELNLTASSLFLSGKPARHFGIQCNKAHFPKLIADNIKSILVITGGASHTAEPDAKELVDLHSYWKQIETPYLLYSLTYMLCDILLWYKQYISTNNDIKLNKSYWTNINRLASRQKVKTKKK